MGSEFRGKLKKLGKNWKNARKRDPGSFSGSSVEDGIYKLHVTDAELTESQSSGRLQVHWGFTVADGESKGEIVHDYDGLESEDNLFHLQRKLTRLGKEAPEDPLEIEGILAEIIKERPLIRGRVKTKDDFTHVYINKLLSESSENGEPEGEEAEGEEPGGDAEPESEGEESGDVQLEEGMKVSFRLKGKDVEGEILNFIENDTKARVKTSKGVFKLDLEKLEPVEGEAEPEEVEPEAEEEESEPEPEVERPNKAKGKATKGRVRKVGGRK